MKVLIPLLAITALLFFSIISMTQVTAISQTSCTPAPSGLVAWWAGDGDATDLVDGNDGTPQNGATFTPGLVGDAFSFDGEDDVVTVPNGPSLNFGPNSPMTVELWAYRTGLASIMHLVGKRTGCGFNDFNYQMAFDPSRGLLFGGDPINSPVTTGQQMPLNTWMHLAGTFDGTTFRFYINGVLAGTSIGTLGPINNASLEIGNSGACMPFAGMIDEVSLYDRALSALEIQDIFNAGSAAKCKATPTPTPTATPTPIPTNCVQSPPGAISWWPLDETSGTIAADRVGNNPGAYANGPVPAAGKVRGALRFDGSNYVAVADSDQWAFGTNDFTIDLWANWDVPGSGSIGEPGDIFIGSDEGPGLRNKWFFALGGGVLDFTVYNVANPPSNFFLVRAPFSPVVGQWYHLAVTKRGTLFTIFVNGVAVGSEISTSPIANANAPLTIGQAENIGFMNGRLDEVSISNRALTQEELKAIFDAASAGKCINLSISPNRGGDTGNVSVHISGSGFAQGASVKQVRTGQPDLVGDSVTVGVEGTTIETTFNLTGKSLGLWSLVVTNPDNTTFTLPESFTIEQGRAPKVWVDVVGLNLIRPGRTQSFHVFYGNTGNVDAVGVPLWIAGIPPDATVSPGFEVLPPVPVDDPTVDFNSVPTTINVGNEIVMPLLVSVVPAGFTGVIEFKLTITRPQTIRLRVWTNPPIFHSPPSQDAVDCMVAILSEATGEILDNDCTAAALTELYTLIIDRGKNTYENLTWSILNVAFECAVQSACELCKRRLTQACVVCVSGKIIEFGMDIYDEWQTGTACANTGIEIGETILEVSPVSSFDPNDKVGSPGVGEQHFLPGEEPLRYSVFFENLETATAPVQELLITDQLDIVNMDLNTLSLGPIAFGTRQVIPPPGVSAFATDVDLRPDKNLIVRITASLNPNTGLLTWRFASIDPATGNPPEDPLAGFLPPDMNPPEGDGSVLFTVMPKKNLATGTTIRNKARIVFDVNEPIDTPEWFNTIDNSKPTSNVLMLTASQCASNVQVQWSGTDEGSGIASYNIYVSDNGAPFTVWQQNTTATSGTYTGQFGHTYAFYSLAQDKTGNIEDAPANSDATVTVIDNTPPTITTESARPASLWPPNHTMRDVLVNYTAIDNCSSTCTLSVTSNEPVNGTGDGDTAPDWEIVDAHHVRLRAERAAIGIGRTYTITVTCTDGAGNSASKNVAVFVSP